MECSQNDPPLLSSLTHTIRAKVKGASSHVEGRYERENPEASFVNKEDSDEFHRNPDMGQGSPSSESHP